MSKTTLFTAVLSIVLSAACTDRLTAPQAVELVNTVEKSQRLGEVWMSDLRLAAALTTDLRRDGENVQYRAIVFERVVLPGQLVNSICAGTRRSAYFWRADGDGVAFFPAGGFDERFVPVLANCQLDTLYQSSPHVTAVTSNRGTWLNASVDGDISQGRVTGSCRFLEPEAKHILNEEFGITCELTNHRVRFGAVLFTYTETGPDSMRLELDARDIIGVRYTINCGVAKNRVSGPCAAPMRL